MSGWQALVDAFAWPWMLAALPMPLLAWWWLPARPMSAGAALRLPHAESRLYPLAGGAGQRRAGLGGFDLLAMLAWTLLCIAAARPQTLGPPQVPPQSGRELMLAVDISGSMERPDMVLGGRRVDRLTVAKAVLADFLDRRRGDRIGLIVFGHRAHVITPLTRDLESVRQQLRDVTVGMAGRETAIGDAIGLAVKRLRDQPEGHRVLVLLTDGDNSAGTLTPRKAAELAVAEKVRIHAIAFGGDAAAARGFGLAGPPPGIDEDTLRAVADATGGEFFLARDTGSLAGIYAEIERLEPVVSEGHPVRPRIEHYWRWLASALAIGVLAGARRLWRAR